jgi:hypothetical protein
VTAIDLHTAENFPLLFLLKRDKNPGVENFYVEIGCFLRNLNQKFNEFM